LVIDLDVRGVTDTDIVSVSGSSSSVSAATALARTRNEAGHVFRLTVPAGSTFTGATTQFSVVVARLRLPLTQTFSSPTYPIGVNQSC
jgi:hypothetical protein